MVADRADSDTGFVGERLEQLGGELTQCLREDFPAGRRGARTPATPTWSLLLGSHHGVADAGPRGRRRRRVGAGPRAASTLGVPVIGICYGAQLAAHALGGVVTGPTQPEIGWYYVDRTTRRCARPARGCSTTTTGSPCPTGARRSVSPPPVRRASRSSRRRSPAAGGLAVPPRGDPGRVAALGHRGCRVLPGQGVDAAAFVAEARGPRGLHAGLDPCPRRRHARRDGPAPRQRPA